MKLWQENKVDNSLAVWSHSLETQGLESLVVKLANCKSTDFFAGSEMENGEVTPHGGWKLQV